MIAYNEARNLVNNLIKRTKIQYYRHKLEHADNTDLYVWYSNFVNQTKDRECCNIFADFFIKKIETLIDQRESTNITITESVLYKETLDGFRTCDVNEVSHILKNTCALD